MTSSQMTPPKPQQAVNDNAPQAPATRPSADLLDPVDSFPRRHLGPGPSDVKEMLALIGLASLDDLIDQTVPPAIRTAAPLSLPEPQGEFQTLQDLHNIASQNQVFRSCIGMGYYDCITPPVIARNILEDPCWYTQYTPYQAEISQGRLEALLNFQTMVADLTGLPLAGASLLDEATAAAEAMTMCAAIARKSNFFIAQDCHPQTIAVVKTRARSQGIDITIGDPKQADLASGTFCGILVQYPTTDGRIECYEDLAKSAHENGALLVAAADLLALAIIRPPAEWGADIAVGSAQRFGVPMGFGGPHAGYISTTENYARKMPGRIIGVSRDAQGNTAYRMAIQTREQHIRREKATSNICTAQALLAIMAGMYATYHGPTGLQQIAQRVHTATQALRLGLSRLGHKIEDDLVFDTLRIRPTDRSVNDVLDNAATSKINLRDFNDGTVGISLDETVDRKLLTDLLAAFGDDGSLDPDQLAADCSRDFPPSFARTSDYLTHPVFNAYHCETDLLRYITKLQSRDLSLANSMIPLGSCTMKLNATSEMLPISWPQFARMHPFAPPSQTRGYAKLFTQLESWLADITGFAAVSLQPNAGSQGEYAGLLTIRAYHESLGQTNRNICIIPTSAHGTNPASAITAGMKVVPVACDDKGNIDVADLKAKCAANADTLGALMVTYPSTHGVFEESIKEICSIVHEHGGQVYMDGANLNAQLGLCKLGEIGADVSHLNLHKTFCIPHGGGGPGVGPIAVAQHLAPFLPGHPVVNPDHATDQAIGAISAAPYGSASILPISWMYIAMMGPDGLTDSGKIAILNANYMANRLQDHYDVLYTGPNGRVAHEFIIDCREFDKSAGIKIDDIAKRLMDYGFHAPTMAWPVPGTLMIEPTESEPKAELDRLCDALIKIREEIRDIDNGKLDREDNPLKNAPHTIEAVSSDNWSHPYSRAQAAYPAPWLKDAKFWPHVGRIDNPYGDRNLFCTCPPVENYAQDD